MPRAPSRSTDAVERETYEMTYYAAKTVSGPFDKVGTGLAATLKAPGLGLIAEAPSRVAG